MKKKNVIITLLVVVGALASVATLILLFREQLQDLLARVKDGVCGCDCCDDDFDDCDFDCDCDWCCPESPVEEEAAAEAADFEATVTPEL